jgi:schlafen family protein
VETPFGATFDKLTPAKLEAFLLTAGGEPLSWEAKADDAQGQLKTTTVAQAICAFANSERGGFLIVGATQQAKTRAWSLPGLVHPNRPADIPKWLSDVAGSIRPSPTIDVMDLPALAPRGPVAVAWIPPVAEPPALTADGLIFIRVAGASPPVTDPRVLAELFGRGRVARASTEEAVSQAVRSIGMDTATIGLFTFGASGGPKGYDSPLFTPAVVEGIEAAAVRKFAAGRLSRPKETGSGPGFLNVRVEMLGSEPHFTVRVFRSGVVAIRADSPQPAQGPALTWVQGREWLRTTWELAWTILKLMRVDGRLHIDVRVNRQLGIAYDPMTYAYAVERWRDLGPPDESDVRLLERELSRTAGDLVLDD